VKRAGVLALGAAGAVLAVAAAPQDGKQAFDRRCGGCHAMDRDKEGPRLCGVYKRAAASSQSFSYSEALRKSGLTWDDETLDRWLTDSEKLVPATDMPVRVESAAERAAIIAYLKSYK
jgi:cytochrome c